MKWLRTLVLFDKGGLIASSDWKDVHDSYVRAISAIDHPSGSGTLTLRQRMRLPTGEEQRNGVKYLRSRFLHFMTTAEGWRPEGNVDLARDELQPPIRLYPSLEIYREPITSVFGGFDFVTTASKGTRIAIEWETGNISSSHRSMNKLGLALTKGIIDVGVLIVPSRKLYEQLTDRVGNIGELSGYLAVWESIKGGVKHGLLAITVVEHDALSSDPALPYLIVGRDGRAKKRAVKP